MKFKYSQEAAKMIAAEIANTLPSLHPDTLLIHVPTITSHVRQRGFDHAELIARELSKLTGLRHVSALARIGQHRQVGSSRGNRIAGVDGVFRIRYGYLIKKAEILLIDDVLTTGATVESAAETLKSAGAKRIDAAIFARSV